MAPKSQVPTLAETNHSINKLQKELNAQRIETNKFEKRGDKVEHKNASDKMAEMEKELNRLKKMQDELSKLKKT
ncbi:hypothetical protein A2U01_0060358 [Trifolium medium]|uniref:Uncharacterized protein n=1 Tax=Trifolium medium TaxID=97028 RepID=A0A392RR48_9FABA|nr:hypothetical protein [Trifolium medium]